MKEKEVWIVSAARTAIGKFGGALKEISAPKLGSFAIKHVLDNVGLNGKEVDEVIMGQVLQTGCGQAPARQAAIYAGIPASAAAITIRKECASSLIAVAVADSRIRAGEAKVVVAGGMENMSQSPFFIRRNLGKSLGHGDLIDAMLYDGLEDAYEKGHPHMGKVAEYTAKKYEISREEQDKFAFSSFLKSKESVERGRFWFEILPLPIYQNKDLVFGIDEGIRETSLEKLAALKPAFKRKGTITAGNASQLSDGASALLLMTKEKAESLGIKSMARILGQATFSLLPKWYPIAPQGAIKKVLQKCNLGIKDIDFFEINEAFAVVVSATIKGLEISEEKVNVKGGAIALGHPIGASGARILTTLVHTLKDKCGRFGVAAICNGGGEAVAILVENLKGKEEVK